MVCLHDAPRHVAEAFETAVAIAEPTMETLIARLDGTLTLSIALGAEVPWTRANGIGARLEHAGFQLVDPRTWSWTSGAAQ